MDQGDDSEGIGVFPDAEIFHAAHLGGVSEGGGEARVEAEGAGCAEGGEEGAVHEVVLEEGGACGGGG